MKLTSLQSLQLITIFSQTQTIRPVYQKEHLPSQVNQDDKTFCRLYKHLEIVVVFHQHQQTELNHPRFLDIENEKQLAKAQHLPAKRC